MPNLAVIGKGVGTVAT